MQHDAQHALGRDERVEPVEHAAAPVVQAPRHELEGELEREDHGEHSVARRGPRGRWAGARRVIEREQHAVHADAEQDAVHEPRQARDHPQARRIGSGRRWRAP